MENPSNDYHISFFKPTTPQAKANRNIALWLIMVWAIAIFGFHFLMRAIEKPTPEPQLGIFEGCWENVKNGSASQAELQAFGQSTLHVLSKIVYDSTDNAILKDALSWSLSKLTADSLKQELSLTISNFQAIRDTVSDIRNEVYVARRNALSDKLGAIINLPKPDIRLAVLPLEVASNDRGEMLESTVVKLPNVMKKYLTHNRSFLTDTKFLGFPFHYFYSAVFLLILFVGLCWVYCKITDKLNAKFGIVD